MEIYKDEQLQDTAEQPAGEFPVEETPAEEPVEESVPEQPEEQPEEPAQEPSEQHMKFEVYAEPAPRQKPEPKSGQEKKKTGVWVLVAVLVIALVAQMVFMAGVVRNTVSVTGTSINEKGELIVIYSDGSQENLGAVVGNDGADGKDGSDGKDGAGSSAGVTVSDISAAVATGLRSSVCVACTFVQEGRRGSTSQFYSAGSGVIYRMNKENGSAFIITNYHVVFDSDSRTDNGIAEQIEVYLYGSVFTGMEMEATYVGGSMYYDIAILYVEGSELLKNSDAVAISTADSDDVQVGSTAIAIGNAEGKGISASNGVVSVDSEYLTMTAADDVTSVSYRVMRIDTAVNSGNSGGGLFNDRGQLIGIVNAKIIDDGVENIGYALPSNVVTAVADNIIDYCFNTDGECVMRPMMGVSVVPIDSYAEYDSETGAIVIRQTIQIAEVDSTQIGKVFQVEDILVSATLNDETRLITRQHHIIDLMLNARVGDVVEFTVLRNGEEQVISVTITEDCLTEY